MELLIIIIVVLLVSLVLLQVYFSKKKKKWTVADVKFCKDAWQKVLSERDLEHKVMDADKLLAYMLKRNGYQESLGGIMKNNSAMFSDINGLWHAHKMRNKLAHEMNYTVRDSDVKIALRSFKTALRDIGLKV